MYFAFGPKSEDKRLGVHMILFLSLVIHFPLVLSPEGDHLLGILDWVDGLLSA